MKDKIENLIKKYKTASFIKKENVVVFNAEHEKARQRINDFFNLIDELQKVCEIKLFTYVNNENLQEYLAIKILNL